MRIIQILIILFILSIAACSPKVSEMVKEEKISTVDTDIDIHEFRKKAPEPGPAPKITLAKQRYLIYKMD